MIEDNLYFRYLISCTVLMLVDMYIARIPITHSHDCVTIVNIIIGRSEQHLIDMPSEYAPYQTSVCNNSP
jgi:hypothetical protein